MHQVNIKLKTLKVKKMFQKFVFTSENVDSMKDQMNNDTLEIGDKDYETN